jgi:putative ABC transport system permease protein
LVKGRNFSKEFGTDSLGLVINESTAKVLGYDDPIGKKIYTTGFKGNNNAATAFNIIGVVKNFNYQSLHELVGPLVFLYGKNPYTASFKVKPSQIGSIISQVQSKWKTMASGMPFSYRFLDDSFNDMYKAEQRAGKLALIFSILTILIACLGLFGLASFIAEQRTKEIGIRKVLGASVNGIISLLSKDFMKLVLIASVLAFPVAWWCMHHWLQDFAYRINIGWWLFVLAAAIALMIALVTVSFQAIKAAIANPVKSLRTE